MIEVKAVPTNEGANLPDSTAQVVAQDTTPKAEVNEAEQLRMQLKALETKVAEAQKEARGHQRVASEKERKIQELTRQRGGGDKKLQSDIADLMERIGGEEGLNDPTLLAKAKQIRAAAQVEEQIAYAEQRRQQVTDEVEQTIRTAGLDPKDEAFDNIWDRLKLDYFTDGEGGEFGTVKERARRIVEKMKPNEPKPETTKIEEKEFEERYRAWLEKEGKLVSDTNIPSGTGVRNYTRKEIADMSMEDYKKNKSNIDKAYAEGRIK